MSDSFKTILIVYSLVMTYTVANVVIKSRDAIDGCHAEMKFMDGRIDDIKKDKKTDMELSDAITKSALRAILFDGSLTAVQKNMRIKAWFAL